MQHNVVVVVVEKSVQKMFFSQNLLNDTSCKQTCAVCNKPVAFHAE